jgi:hypothetical protein
VQAAGQGDRRGGVVGDVGGDLQRHVAIRAGRALPLRPEQFCRLGQILQGQRVNEVLRIGHARVHEARQ